MIASFERENLEKKTQKIFQRYIYQRKNVNYFKYKRIASKGMDGKRMNLKVFDWKGLVWKGFEQKRKGFMGI